MPLQNLTERECGGSNPLINLTQHLIRDKVSFRPTFPALSPQANQLYCLIPVTPEWFKISSKVTKSAGN